MNAQLMPLPVCDTCVIDHQTLRIGGWESTNFGLYKEYIKKTRINRKGTKRMEKGVRCNAVDFTTMTKEVRYIYGRERRFRRVIRLK